MIGVDWGTTNFRAFRLDEDGKVFDWRSSSVGVLNVRGGRFGEALLAEVGGWLTDGEQRILLCGMVGSREGWAEAQYLCCPVGIEEIADSVIKVPFAGVEVRLVPGVRAADAYGIPEVMRGEETKALGILDACGGNDLACLPGTHSKWIHLRDRKIAGFFTCMTGEVYAALSKCTILARMMTAEAGMDQAAFLLGVARSADGGGLLHHLFSVRTLALMDRLKEEASASYLSGLLIGHEVRDAMPTAAHVHVVGAAPLCSLYAKAIRACGGSCALGDEDAAARGLAAIGRRLNWT